MSLRPGCNSLHSEFQDCLASALGFLHLSNTEGIWENQSGNCGAMKLRRNEKVWEEEEQQGEGAAGLTGPCGRVPGTLTLRVCLLCQEPVLQASTISPPLKPPLGWVYAFFTSYLYCAGATWTSWQDRTKGRKGMSHCFLVPPGLGSYSLLSGGATENVAKHVLILS